MKRLLLLLGFSSPWCISATSLRSSAFVSSWSTVPSKTSTTNVPSRTHQVIVPSWSHHQVKKDDSTETLEHAPQQRGFRGFFARRKGGRSKKAAQVRMQTLDTAEDISTTTSSSFAPPLLWNKNGTDDWIRKDLESFKPSSMDEITGNQRASSLFSSSRMKMGSNSTMAIQLESPPPPATTTTTTSTIPKTSLLTRMTRNWFQSILVDRLYKWSAEDPINLQVRASPRGNILRNLMRGQYRSNVELVFEKVKFGNIQISGGGQIHAKRLVLNYWGFLLKGMERFPAQFEFHASNCTLTSEDLLQSSCIRNGLGRLLVRILRNAGVSKTADVTITSVDILPSNKISCLGTAKTRFGGSVDFQVRSGISTSCRGHVLTFPGLEVTLQPALGVFLPVVPDINLDVGHNARMLKVKINGNQKKVTLDASVSITPLQSKKWTSKYIQSHEAYLAQFCFDVGQWITDIGNFTK